MTVYREPNTVQWGMGHGERIPMNMKRRVIYIDDETWEQIRQLAEKQKTTMSEAIRKLMKPTVITAVETKPPVNWSAPIRPTMTPGLAPRSTTVPVVRAVPKVSTRKK